MGVLIDLTGRDFDRLKVLARAGTRRQYDERGRVLRSEPEWLCSCKCGAVVTVLGVNLREKRTRSCGCLSRDIHREIARDLCRRRWESNEPTATPEGSSEDRVHQ